MHSLAEGPFSRTFLGIDAQESMQQLANVVFLGLLYVMFEGPQIRRIQQPVRCARPIKRGQLFDFVEKI